MKYNNILIIICCFCSFQIFAQSPDWSVNVNSFEYNMNLTVFLNVDGRRLNNTEDKVGAFVGEEKRGEASIVYNENVDKYVAYLTTYANTTGDTLTFKIYDSQNDTIINAIQSIAYDIDGNVGDVFQSYHIGNVELEKGADFTSFTFDGITEVFSHIFKDSIEVGLPTGTNKSDLVPLFETSKNATVFRSDSIVTPGTDTLDMFSPIIYQVLSEDESMLRTYTVYAYDITSINELLAEGLELYPNPFNETLRINTSNKEIKKIVLYNSIGIKVTEFNIHANQQQNLNTTTFSKGVYLLQLVDKNGDYFVRKIIKK